LDYLTKGAIFYGDRIGIGLGTKSLYRPWSLLMVHPFATDDVEFWSIKDPKRGTGQSVNPVQFFSLYLS
jgi:hypothetical protein